MLTGGFSLPRKTGFSVVTLLCLKMLRAVEARGGNRRFGSNTGECIEVKTREPLNSTMETLNGGSQ
ncbi:hypothetical protein AAGM76_27875 [Klebsiella pneumoniae]